MSYPAEYYDSEMLEDDIVLGGRKKPHRGRSGSKKHAGHVSVVYLGTRSHSKVGKRSLSKGKSAPKKVKSARGGSKKVKRGGSKKVKRSGSWLDMVD